MCSGYPSAGIINIFFTAEGKRGRTKKTKGKHLRFNREQASSYGFRNGFRSAHQKAGIKAQTKPKTMTLLHEEWYLTAMQGGLPWDKPLSVRCCFARVTKTQSTAEYPAHQYCLDQLPVEQGEPSSAPGVMGSSGNRTHHGNGGVELGNAHPARRVLAVEALVGEAAAVTGLHRWLRGVGVQVNELLTWAQRQGHINRESHARSWEVVIEEEEQWQRNPHSRHILLSATSPNLSHPGTAASTTMVATPL